MKYLSLYTKNRIRHMAKKGKQVSEIIEVTGLSYEKVKSCLDGLKYLKTKRIASKYSKKYE